MDAHEQLIIESESESCVAVLGRGQEFLLIPLGTESVIKDARIAEAHRRGGFAYCGVMGVKQGRVAVEIALENPMAAHAMCFAGIAFAQEVADRLLPERSRGDSVQWLETLAGLKDRRKTGGER